MKKKLLIALMSVLLVFAFTACGGSSESADTGTTAAEEPATYESILEDYSQQLADATPGLVDEYNEECAKLTSMEEKAELCNEKVEELAEICNEGIEKMAEIQLDTGDYDEYEEWAGKLQDKYSELAAEIQDAYTDSCM